MKRIKKDKATGLPQLPEGWGPWEIYEEQSVLADFWPDTVPHLRIRLTTPTKAYERNILGTVDPIRLRKSDIRRAAKRLIMEAHSDVFRRTHKSPFIGVYPPKSL